MPSGLLSYEGGVYPCLNLKAYNGRLFLMFFQVVLCACIAAIGPQLTESMKTELELASAMVTALTVFFHRMEAAGRYLSEQEASGLMEATTTFLQLYGLLALRAVRQGIARWKATPKFHMLRHLAEDMVSTRINCRSFHCYIDEDFIGHWKKLAVAVPRELMEFRMLTRYLLRLKALHPTQ